MASMEELTKKYQGRVHQDLLTDAMLGRNRIKLYQKHFQKADGLPVYLKGTYGIPFYRFMMWFVGIGAVGTIGVMGLMATNKIPKKER